MRNDPYRFALSLLIGMYSVTTAVNNKLDHNNANIALLQVLLFGVPKVYMLRYKISSTCIIVRLRTDSYNFIMT